MATTTLESAHGNVSRMPGHWVLASIGKRVLRPGGRELTRNMIDRLRIGPSDHVIEFAPGIGETAKSTIATGARYVGVDMDPGVVERLSRRFPSATFVHASAADTGLPGGCATVVYGEAMLSMQSPSAKRRIVAEAARLLVDGGRYAIHELCLAPDNVPDSIRRSLEAELSMEIHVGVRPLTAREWRNLLEAEGFAVYAELRAAMRLLEPSRLLADEGPGGLLRIGWNLVRRPDARKRVLAMRHLFRKYERHLAAVSFVATRKGPSK